MIDKIWYGKSKLVYLLLPLMWLYEAIILLRKKMYQLGIFRRWRSPVPVIVVGNISVGGTGKTPFVIWLVNILKQSGLRVGVVSRGYGGKADHYPYLVNDHSKVQETSDEPLLIYQRTQVPIVIAPQRVDAVKEMLSAYSIDVVITDDGLQHYALERDIEIAIIDGKRWFGNGHLLPAGPLREKPSRLTTVDICVLNSGDCCSGYHSMILQPMQLINLKTKQKRPISSLGSVVAIAGIGHPERFFNTLESVGVSILASYSFLDHYHYTLQDLEDKEDEGYPLVMTEKDAVKCFSFAKDNWWYLPIKATFSEQDTQSILSTIYTKLPSLNRTIG